jgi:hypothetical protein
MQKKGITRMPFIQNGKFILNAVRKIVAVMFTQWLNHFPLTIQTRWKHHQITWQNTHWLAAGWCH